MAGASASGITAGEWHRKSTQSLPAVRSATPCISGRPLSISSIPATATVPACVWMRSTSLISGVTPAAVIASVRRYRLLSGSVLS